MQERAPADSPVARLADLIARYARGDGRTATPHDGVAVFRADRPTPLRSSIYEPAVIVVAQGRKQAYLGGEVYEYSPSSYLVLPIALPVDSRVVEASPERPFLSLAVRVEPTELARIVVDSGDQGSPEPDVGRGIAVSAVDAALLDTSIRLMSSLGSEMDRRVLAPQAIREILYRVLTGPQGGLLRAAGSRDGRLSRVARALAMMHRSFDDPIEVPTLAREAHMSESAFYDAFKSVTSLTPIQYLKEIRLDRARQIMIWEGVSAKRAVLRVGYASPSQFSREFKRRFGRPPGAERASAIESGEVAGPRPY